MNRTVFALAALAALTGLGGCVDNSDSAPLRIMGNVAPDEGCAVDSASNVFLDDGIIESGAFQGYVLTPSARNDLQTVGEELLGPKTIYVDHAHVELSFDDPDFQNITSDPSLLSFNVRTTGVLEPNGGSAAFSFEITPPELLALIGQRLGTPTAENPRPRTVIAARVQLVGTRGGGGGEEVSNVFQYPVEVCVDCLAFDVGACSLLEADFMPRTGSDCNPAQDQVTDCCDNFTVCPAAPPPPASR